MSDFHETNLGTEPQNQHSTYSNDQRMTFSEARAYLHVGDSTLRNYVRTGRIKAQRLAGGQGRLLFFRRSDLDALYEDVEPAQADKLQGSNSGVANTSENLIKENKQGSSEWNILLRSMGRPLGVSLPLEATSREDIYGDDLR